jgi:polysaccharide biosynthesis transport protein
MTLSQFLRILRAHAGSIFLTFVLIVGATAIVTEMLPREYISTTAIVIEYRGSGQAAQSMPPAQLYPGYLATQVDVLQSQSVALQVVDKLGLVSHPELQSQYFAAPLAALFDDLSDLLADVGIDLNGLWQGLTERLGLNTDDGTGVPDQSLDRYRLADQLLKRLDVNPTPDSSVIKLSYTAANASAAARAANMFVTAYQQTTLNLNTDPARESSSWYDEQLSSLRAELDQARSKFSKFQQSTGIVATDENVDVENARLTELSAQLAAAQAENHPSIQGLKQDLARAEAALAQLPPQLGPNHPQVQRAKAEVQSLRAKLASQSAQVVGDIRGQMAAQKSSVLQMKEKRGELAALKDDVDNAQRAYDQALQMANANRMQSHVNQSNVSVLRAAVPPIRPSSPNLALNLALAAVVAAILSVGFALWREVSQRFVRCAADLRELAELPVLGVLLPAGPAASRVRALPRPIALRRIGSWP